ncbi:unnamed protein product [Blepharisma stoltei]|uniref:Receptor ligand binding region domain-containing protein n=1 Tax=Blepharisma stoltei TaxID=1481888 RepID=A0AAU9IYM0_9CILI|nr:unnamed protein product [Blepharisma stoltei]
MVNSHLITLFAVVFKICAFLEIIAVQLGNEYKSINSFWFKILESDLTQNFSDLVDWHNCSYSAIINCISQYPNSLVLLDLSRDPAIQQSLSKICDDYSLFHLVYQKNSKYVEKSTYSLTLPPSEEIDAFASLLSYFNWTQGAVFLDEESYSLKNENSVFSSGFDCFTIASLTDIDGLVSRSVVSAGITLYYFLLENEKSQDLQKSLIKAKLLTRGNGIVLNQESGYQCEIDGALIISEKGYEYENSLEEYLKSSIKEIISLIAYVEDAKEIRRLLDLEMPNHYRIPKFSIVNIQNGERITVGTIINRNVSIFGNLTFLGQSSSIPKSNRKILPISINAGITNPGSENVYTALHSSYGSNICIDKINEGSEILLNFQLEMFNFDCGVSIYNAAFLKSCYQKDIDKLGLAHLSGYGSSVAIGSLVFFKQANITIPSVGAINGSTLLSSIKDYPMYVRMLTPFAYNTCVQFIRAMGWRKVAIIYSNNTVGLTSYNLVKNTVEAAGIDIVNAESARMIYPNLDRNSINDYKYVFQEIYNSRARLVLMMVQCPMCLYALEEFYDVGLRRGDIYIYIATWDIFDIIANNDAFLHKRLEIGASMTTLVFSNWVGEVGKDAFSRYLDKYKKEPNLYACAYYDAVYFIAKALDYMITKGQDYTDPWKLMSVIRLTKFEGCMGPASIESESNDRNFQMYTIQSMKVDKNGSIAIYPVGYLKPFSTNLIYILNPLIYPDGTSAKPSDLREINDKCPFPDRDIQTFSKGRGLMVGLCLIVLAITSAITWFIWQKWWNIPVEIFGEKQEMSVDDFIVAITIPIEFFQFASMGPYYLPSLISTFINISTVDLEEVFKLRDGGFYIIVDIVLAWIGVWIIFCVVVLLKLHDRWEDVWIFRNIDILAENLMPILGNLCFMPFISICLDVFLCDEAIGDSFTDSFLLRDCYAFCWQDSHLVYAIISFVAILVYEPLAVFYRPLWQELQGNLHVKTIPGYLMVKSVAQTLLVVLAKTLKRASNISHGVIFIVIMMIYVAIIVKIKSYNYGRFHLWQVLSLIAVVWLALISTWNLGIGGNPIAYYAFLVFGWIAIMLAGFYLQRKKYPSLLYRKKGRDMWNLFRFAFALRSIVYEVRET